MHIERDGTIRPTSGSKKDFMGRRPYPGHTKALKEMMDHINKPMPWLCWARKFHMKGTIGLPEWAIQSVADFLGQYHESINGELKVRNTEGPVTIEPYMQTFGRSDGQDLMFKITGPPASQTALDAWRRKSLTHDDVVWESVWKVPRRTKLVNQGMEVDGLLLWHCTTIKAGLMIMAQGRPKLPFPTTNNPNGIYSSGEPIDYYNQGCAIQFEVFGVRASEARTQHWMLTKGHTPIPIGAIFRVRRAQEEWIFHPDSATIRFVQFDKRGLLNTMRRSGIAEFIHIPIP